MKKSILILVSLLLIIRFFATSNTVYANNVGVGYNSPERVNQFYAGFLNNGLALYQNTVDQDFKTIKSYGFNSTRMFIGIRHKNDDNKLF